MSGTLYLVATPIGNLGDFSPRAVETLAAVDFIAAEDTRVSLRLLNHFGVKKPLVSYHEHNPGTPAVSDPGEDLVRLCAEAEVPVTAIPGCCAGISALAVSGLPTGRFVFEGFLPVNRKNRRERLEALAGEERTILFHEAPHKLLTTLEDLSAAFGPDRRVALCRELTKLHEEVRRTILGEALDFYRANAPKGEFVLVVAGAEPQREAALSLEEAVDQVLALRARGDRLKDAVKEVAEHTGLSRNELYAAALARDAGPGA